MDTMLNVIYLAIRAYHKGLYFSTINHEGG